MADLSELFARLKNPALSDSPTTGTQEPSRNIPSMQLGSEYHQPSVSSPTLSPPPDGPQPRHSDILSAVTSMSPTPAPDQDSDRTAGLLNLLKSTPSSAQREASRFSNARPQNQDPSAGISASDLVASFARQSPAPSRLQDSYAASSTPLQAPTAAHSTSNNPQDMLLNLLKRTESSTPSRSASGAIGLNGPVMDDHGATTSTPQRVFGALNDGQSSPFEPQVQSAKNPVFTYVNPFDSLPSPSPQPGSPFLEATGGSVGPRSGKRPPSATRLGRVSQSASPSPAKAQRTHAESVSTAQSRNDITETVSEALDDVAEKASRAVDTGLASAEINYDKLQRNHPSSEQELKEAVHDAAVEIRDELRDGKTKTDLERQISKPMTAALQVTASEIAQEGVLDSWDRPEDEEAEVQTTDKHAVQVYNLPMRPFVALSISGAKPPPSTIRPDVVMKIASLKKDLDQADRTLASASSNHIVYVMAKGGGFRIIRQDDGSNKTVFRLPEHQIFNVVISSSTDSDAEIVLATGTNGSVYWTNVPSQADINVEDLEKRSFIFPPPPSPDENTSNSQLKTRAKKSSRHQQFFAMGRGKSIHLIWSAVAQSDAYFDRRNRIVDSVKYLNERALKISIGKAAKDFAFSEDDTSIVSLDKNGRLKFWDISDHMSPNSEMKAHQTQATEITEPAMTLFASSTTERAWPTSVQLVDKERPTMKGTAFRYMLVGLAQNHTIQLWDLGLGKAVQELNLPHAHETDAICSIAYHAKSGIIAIGHPSRNSLYLVHLSAPKYNLPSVSQARYINALVGKDKALPRPESTAIMSGLREISLATIGNLRSIDVIASTQSQDEGREQDDETVFEVYAMHSKGVTCLNLKRQDLGWGRDGKVINGRDAEAEKIVSVAELQQKEPGEISEQDKATNKSSDPPSKAASKASPTKTDVEPATPKAASTPTTQRAQVNGASKAEKKKKKSNEEVEGPQVQAPKIPSYADAAQRAAASQPAPSVQAPAPSQPSNGLEKEPTAVRNVAAQSGSPEAQTIATLLSDHMNSLYRRIDEDKRVQEAASAARQDAVLRLVSSTLTENVEKSLARIVSSSMEKAVLPAISNVTSAALEQKIGQTMAQSLGNALPREIKSALPDALSKALQNPEVLRKISDAVSTRLTPAMEKQFASSMQSTISPAFTKITADVSSKATGEVERRVYERLQRAETQNKRDTSKIDHLTRSISELSSTLTSMANAQVQMQQEFARLRAEIQQRETVSVPTAERREREVQETQSVQQTELQVVADDMSHGRLEQGTVKVCRRLLSLKL